MLQFLDSIDLQAPNYQASTQRPGHHPSAMPALVPAFARAYFKTIFVDRVPKYGRTQTCTPRMLRTQKQQRIRRLRDPNPMDSRTKIRPKIQKHQLKFDYAYPSKPGHLPGKHPTTRQHWIYKRFDRFDFANNSSHCAMGPLLRGTTASQHSFGIASPDKKNISW